MESHPSPDELVDYQEGRLDVWRVWRLLSHLAICQECREDLVLLESFTRELLFLRTAAPPKGWTKNDDEAAERSYRRFQAARALSRRTP
jgi:anti-sigma factor ChrR (cupin superfamily)